MTTWLDDSSGSAHRVCVAGGAARSSAQAKFGTQSALFSNQGTAAQINVLDGLTDFNFGSGPFTIEMFCWFVSHSASNFEAMATQWQATPNMGWWFGMNSSGQLAFFYSTTGSDTPSVVAAHTPTTGAWVHYAVDRDASNVIRTYAGGVVVGSATVASTLFASTQSVMIGNDAQTQARLFPGYIDSLRVSNNTRYGGAFTPPSSAFTSDANTKLLLQFEGGMAGNGVDDGGKLRRAYTTPLNGPNQVQLGRAPTPGPKTVSGRVTELGSNKAGLIVRAYSKITGEMIGQTTTAGDGTYSINCGANWANVYITCLDPTTFQAITFDEVVPG